MDIACDCGACRGFSNASSLAFTCALQHHAFSLRVLATSSSVSVSLVCVCLCVCPCPGAAEESFLRVPCALWHPGPPNPNPRSPCVILASPRACAHRCPSSAPRPANAAVRDRGLWETFVYLWAARVMEPFVAFVRVGAGRCKCTLPLTLPLLGEPLALLHPLLRVERLLKGNCGRVRARSELRTSAPWRSFL